jgi:hypothetical protein
MGFFENFKGSDVILLDGEADGLYALAHHLRKLSDRRVEGIDVHELSFVESHGGTRLTACPVSGNDGVRRSGSGDRHFTWANSEEGWLDAAEKIEAVATIGQSHNWLHSIGNDDATVFVPSGEYDEQWWSKHGSK